MERIALLIEQLQKAFKDDVEPSEMLVTVNHLQHELQKLTLPKTAVPESGRVAVILPAVTMIPFEEPVDSTESAIIETPKEPEKIVELLQVDEDEMEAELEEIRQKAAFAKQMQAKQAQMKPGILFFEDEEEVPTLMHQPNYQPSSKVEPDSEKEKEVQQTASEDKPTLNERLSEPKTEVAQKLTETPVKDLRKAVGINDRFVFINELFRGDEAMYERSIKTINNFSIYPEAQYWIERELKIKLGWDNSRPCVQDFYALVKRRFS